MVTTHPPTNTHHACSGAGAVAKLVAHVIGQAVWWKEMAVTCRHIASLLCWVHTHQHNNHHDQVSSFTQTCYVHTPHILGGKAIVGKALAHLIDHCVEGGLTNVLTDALTDVLTVCTDSHTQPPVHTKHMHTTLVTPHPMWHVQMNGARWIIGFFH